MPVYFLQGDQVRMGQVTITGPLLRHLCASLRTRVGERLWFATRQGHRYLAEITRIDRSLLIGQVVEEQDAPPRRGPSLILGQALLKGEKMDWVVQKATELGVTSIAPLLTAHTVAKPSGARVGRQQERWQGIALEAAQQAERWEIPAISALQAAGQFWSCSNQDGLHVILAERRGGERLASVAIPVDPLSAVTLAVGPEGGWLSSEVEDALAHGWIPVTLGSQVLRADTAALAAVSILQHRLGNLG